MATLDNLLGAARDASPAERINHRDAIAVYGVDALGEMGLWLADRVLGAFAVRVIQVVGRAGYKAEAFAVLAEAVDKAGTAAIKGDIQSALVEFVPPRSRRRLAGQSGFEVLAEDLQLRGRPAVQYRIETHKERGHFNVPRAVMDLLEIPTDGVVDVDVRRTLTGRVVFSGRMGIASGTEIYPTIEDTSTAELRGLEPYESIDVTIAATP
jgi:hypothetical protein